MRFDTLNMFRFESDFLFLPHLLSRNKFNDSYKFVVCTSAGRKTNKLHVQGSLPCMASQGNDNLLCRISSYRPYGAFMVLRVTYNNSIAFCHSFVMYIIT